MLFQQSILCFIAGLACGAGFLVISSKSPVHSVLSLIFSLVLCSFVLLTLEIDILALIFLIVYVGAIAILFLFVVMILNVKVAEARANLFQYFPLGFFLLSLLYFDLGLLMPASFSVDVAHFIPFYLEWPKAVLSFGCLESIGFLLYTYFPFYLIGAGLLLLLAIVGAILLTLHRGVGVHRQEVSFQNRRDWVEVLHMVQ